MNSKTLILAGLAFAGTCLLSSLIAGCGQPGTQPQGPAVQSRGADTAVPRAGTEMASEVTETSDATFKDDVLSSEQPVLVDFFATWCGPCRMVAPIVDELATEHKGKLKVFRVDVDKNPQLAATYHVMAIPFLAVFKGGKLVESSSGALPKEALESKVKPYLD